MDSALMALSSMRSEFKRQELRRLYPEPKNFRPIEMYEFIAKSSSIDEEWVHYLHPHYYLAVTFRRSMNAGSLDYLNWFKLAQSPTHELCEFQMRMYNQYRNKLRSDASELVKLNSGYLVSRFLTRKEYESACRKLNVVSVYGKS